MSQAPRALPDLAGPPAHTNHSGGTQTDSAASASSDSARECFLPSRSDSARKNSAEGFGCPAVAAWQMDSAESWGRDSAATARIARHPPQSPWKSAAKYSEIVGDA